MPHALLHNLKHNKVLHERVILLTVRIEDVPYVAQEKRVEARVVEHDRLVRLVRGRWQDDEVALDLRARGQHAPARHQPRDDDLRPEVLILDRDDLQTRARAPVQAPH